MENGFGLYNKVTEEMIECTSYNDALDKYRRKVNEYLVDHIHENTIDWSNWLVVVLQKGQIIQTQRWKWQIENLKDPHSVCECARGGMADTPDLESGTSV